MDKFCVLVNANKIFLEVQSDTSPNN